MPTQLPASHLNLFDKASITYLGVHLPHGGILVNPVWCSLEGDQIWINSAEGRLKDRMMRQNPAVTLCVTDPEDPYRYLEVRGRVVEITAEDADAHIDALAKRYMGKDTYPFRNPSEVRLIYKIDPEKAVSMPG